MSIRAMPRSAWEARMRSRIWAWTVTSRAVVGSSAISILGSHESPMAIMARCRMPPDSSCGYCLTRRSGELMPTCANAAMARSSASDLPTSMCSRMASAIWKPMVNTGFRLVIGSWKIIAISPPRTRRISSSEQASRSRPSSEIEPEGMRAGGISRSRITVSAVTLLPDPDSPTMPMDLPRGRRKLTPSTALTVPSITSK